MKILIIGAGNGGLAFGAKLMEKGFMVNLYDKFEEIINPIIKNAGVITSSANEGNQPLKFQLVTNELKEAMTDVKFIFVVAPAFAHRTIANDLVKYIEDEQIVILHPGRTGGAMEVKNIFELNGKMQTIVAEAETLLFACRKISNTEIKIYGVKKSVGVAALPSSKSAYVAEELNKMLPYFHSNSNVLATSLANIGSIFHPTPFLLNIGRVECKDNFKYYHEGITPTIAKLLEKLDEERVGIAASFGLETLTALEWVNENYRVSGATLYEAIQLNDSYSEIYAPVEVSSRYVLEDVPMSLVPMSQLAKTAKVATPVMDSIIELASKMYNQDFRTSGRTLERMGLNTNTPVVDALTK